jgi:hypothetical protein
MLLYRIAAARIWDGTTWREPPAINVLALLAVAVVGLGLAVASLLRPRSEILLASAAWCAGVILLAVLLGSFGHTSAIGIAGLEAFAGALALYVRSGRAR